MGEGVVCLLTQPWVKAPRKPPSNGRRFRLEEIINEYPPPPRRPVENFSAEGRVGELADTDLRVMTQVPWWISAGSLRVGVLVTA